MDTKESSGIGTRWDLIERLKNPDDNESWSDFLSLYRSVIYRAAVRAGCTACEAEEVVQETIIAVARRIPVFEANSRRGSFEGWLFRLTRCRVVDQLRKRHKGIHLPAFSDSNLKFLEVEINETEGRSGRTELERSWESEWQQHCLTTALARVRKQITPQHFEVFHRCILLKHPAGEVAAGMNISIDQIYLIKHRVLARVRKELNRAWC